MFNVIPISTIFDWKWVLDYGRTGRTWLPGHFTFSTWDPRRIQKGPSSWAWGPWASAGSGCEQSFQDLHLALDCHAGAMLPDGKSVHSIHWLFHFALEYTRITCYPLVNELALCELEKHHFQYIGKSRNFRWPCSIAMLNYQMVFMIHVYLCFLYGFRVGFWYEHGENCSHLAVWMTYDDINWLVVSNMNFMTFHIYIYMVEWHHTNWRRPSFFRGVGQPPSR